MSVAGGVSARARVHRWLRSSLVVVALSATGLIVAPASPTPAGAAPAQAPSSYTNPVAGGLISNPFVVKSGPTYYAYMSGFDFYLPHYVMAMQSTDLVTWTNVGNVLGSPGAWADASSGTKVTSPSVLYVPTNPTAQQWVMYYTAIQSGTETRCIGLATASSAAGPFTPNAQPFICPPGGAQDPSPVPLWDNPPYQQLVYKAGNTIYNQILQPSGLGLDPSWQPLAIYSAQAGPWPNGIAERPAVARFGTQYYLLFSGGQANTGKRAVGWTSCANGYGIAYNCAAQPQLSPWIQGNPSVAAPNGAQTFSDGTHQWIVYDARPGGTCTPTGCTANPGLRIDKVCAGSSQPRTNAPSTTAQTLTRNPDCATDIPTGWVSTWGSGSSLPAGDFANGFGANTTLRQMTHTSIGGSAVRVTISNTAKLFDASLNTALAIGSATVAVSTEATGSGAAVQTPVPLRFGGATSVSIPAGQSVVSDPVPLAVPQDHDLAVSLHFTAATGKPNSHAWGGETSWVGAGNLTSATGSTGYTESTDQSFFVTSVDVLNDAPQGTVVVLGDSLSDGILAVPADSEHRYSDYLVDQLAAAPPLRLGVANVAIAGNSLLPASDVASGLARFDRDVLSRPDVRTLVVFLGTNDLLAGGRSADDIANGLQQVIDRAHAAGVEVVGATVPPFTNVGGTPDSVREPRRQQLNARIRPGQTNSLPFDATVDFDAVLEDPDHPGVIDPDYAWLGQWHQSEAGHAAMADALAPIVASLNP